jgi:hypothetical protein
MTAAGAPDPVCDRICRKTALGDVGEERIIKKPFIDNELTTKVNFAISKGTSGFLNRGVVPLRR